MNLQKNLHLFPISIIHYPSSILPFFYQLHLFPIIQSPISIIHSPLSYHLHLFPIIHQMSAWMTSLPINMINIKRKLAR